MKSQIIKTLGKAEVLVPALIAEGLRANDRVKVRLSILQAIARHAHNPDGGSFDLTHECHAVAIDPIAMEALVRHGSQLAGEKITTPGLAELGTAVWDDVTTMAQAVKAGDVIEGDAALARVSALRAQVS